MSIKEIINDASVSFEDLCVSTGIPSSTLSDILSGKTELSHCQARTLQKLAKGLGMSMEDVLEMDAVLPDPVEQHPVMVHPVMIPEVFAYYRTSLLEALDEIDEELFVIGVAASGTIEILHNEGMYAEALYTLGLVDYLCDKNGLSRFEQYDRYRGETMAKTIYAQEAVEDPILDCVCFQKMIPQLLKFNFIETPDTLLYY